MRVATALLGSLACASAFVPMAPVNLRQQPVQSRSWAAAKARPSFQRTCLIMKLGEDEKVRAGPWRLAGEGGLSGTRSI